MSPDAKRRGAASPAASTSDCSQGTRRVVASATILDPRKMVGDAPLALLVGAADRTSRDVVAMTYLDIGEGPAFRCPRCGYRDFTRGVSAVVLDDWRWRCRQCRVTGTRYTLEADVLADADAIERLIELIAVEEGP